MTATIHPTADVSKDAQIGDGTRVWHEAQVREGARIGRECIIGKGVYIDKDVVVGDRCKIQNRASLGPIAPTLIRLAEVQMGRRLDTRQMTNTIAISTRVKPDCWFLKFFIFISV